MVNSNAIFWDLARECKSEIHNALMNGTHINLLKKAKLQPDISLDIQREKMIKSILNREKTMGRNNMFAISNRGKLKFTHKANQLKIKALYFATGQHIGGDCFWLGIVTLNDQLFCNFLYVEPLISKKTAELFAKNVIMLLEKVCINPNITLTILSELS
ncbi:hypothetical protein [Hydrocoleum sp. CS-953]|uniref:hypothetical protein n=1 Tax=Hydrocoleum sp. CS-953 TaxID=1671698 RepID=UPI00352A508E